MGRPVGSVIEATYIGTLFGQRIMNVYHYVVTSASNINNVAVETQDFLNAWNNNGTSAFATSYADCLPANLLVDRAYAQFITTARYKRESQDVSQNGTRQNAAVSNLQASITIQDEFSGRNHIGGKRICMTEQDSVQGFVGAGYKVTLNTHAAQIILPVTGPVGAGVYTPCIYHRSPNANPQYHFINTAFAQDTTRVIRRRTVGLGI